MKLKIEKAIQRSTIDVLAIRVYLPEFRCEVDQTVEHGENPRLLIKSTKREKTGKAEIEIVFLGSKHERHLEPLSYYLKNPQKWVTWGLIVLSPQQARQLACILEKITRKTLVNYPIKTINNFSEIN